MKEVKLSPKHTLGSPSLTKSLHSSAKVKLSMVLLGAFALFDYLFCDQRHYFNLKNRCFKLINKKTPIQGLSKEEFEELLKKAGGYQKLADSLSCKLEDFSDSPEEALDELVETLREIIYSNEWCERDYLTSWIKPLAQSEWFLNLVDVIGGICIGSKEKQKGGVSALFYMIFPYILGVSKGGLSCLITNRYLSITLKLLDIALKKNEKPSSLSQTLDKLNKSDFMQRFRNLFSEKRSAYIDISEIVIFIVAVLILKKLFSLSAESYLRNYPPTKPFSLPEYQKYGHLYPREGNEDIKRFIEDDEYNTLFISTKDYELLLESLVAQDRGSRIEKSLRVKELPSDFFFMDLEKMDVREFDLQEERKHWENRVINLKTKMGESVKPILVICRKDLADLINTAGDSFNEYFIQFLLDTLKFCKNPLRKWKVTVVSNEIPEKYRYDQLFRTTEHPAVWGRVKMLKVQKPIFNKRLQQIFKKVDYRFHAPPEKEEAFWERLSSYAEKNSIHEMPSYLINKHFKSRSEVFQKKIEVFKNKTYKDHNFSNGSKDKETTNTLVNDFQKLGTIKKEIRAFEKQCYSEAKQIMPMILKSHLPNLMKYEKYHYLATSIILRKKLLLPKMREDYWQLKNKIEKDAKKLDPHFTFDWLRYLEMSG